MSPALKYSNLVVTAVLFVVGTRVLFVIVRAFLHSSRPPTQNSAIFSAQAIMAALFTVASRSLAVMLCAWSAFSTLSLTHLKPQHRIEELTFCMVLVLTTAWFYLPQVKVQFAPKPELLGNPTNSS